MVLPHGMMTSTTYMMMSPYHVNYRLHADINSTDDDMSPSNWPYLTTTLTADIFQTITLFDDSFVSLESLRRALHDHAIFTEFWEL